MGPTLLHTKGLSAEFEQGGMYAVFHFTVWRTGEGVTENDRDLPQEHLSLFTHTSKRSSRQAWVPEPAPSTGDLKTSVERESAALTAFKCPVGSVVLGPAGILQEAAGELLVLWSVNPREPGKDL